MRYIIAAFLAGALTASMVLIGWLTAGEGDWDD